MICLPEVLEGLKATLSGLHSLHFDTFNMTNARSQIKKWSLL